eukprot:8546497-Lingulodinium_polyedra.AAC.1
MDGKHRKIVTAFLLDSGDGASFANMRMKNLFAEVQFPPEEVVRDENTSDFINIFAKEGG